MRYIQLVEFDSAAAPEDVRASLDDWVAATQGKRTLETAIVATDHERPNHYWELLEFSSEDEAAKSNGLPETKAAYDRWLQLLSGDPVFHNLDVVEHIQS
jgi:hypothetical protein